MGGDGGVLAKQRRFMRGIGGDQSKQNEKEMAKRARALIRLRCCAISNEALREPVVACELGNLFNKEAVLTSLLERTLNVAFEHIRGMKDVIPCKFTVNPNFKELYQDAANESKGDTQAIEGDHAVVCKYVCPVTRVEMNAKQPFVVVRPTGWVMSERAVRDIGIENLQEEYGPFTEEDVIRLAPDEEEEAVLRERMVARRSKAKKDKKRKRLEDLTAGEGAEPSANGEGAQVSKKKEKKQNGSGHRQISPRNGMGVGDSKVSSVVDAAKKVAEKQMGESSVFKSLFNDGKWSEGDAKKLFAQSGAARYTCI